MFDSKFEIFIADSEFGRSINRQIRYRVFCLERGFEDPEHFSLGEESDEWDSSSVHFIVREKNTGRWVASTRMIFPEQGLPVDSLESISEDFTLGIKQKGIGEISRFCIINKNIKTSSQFGQVNAAQFDWIGGVDNAEQFEVTLGMLRALSEYGLNHGLDYSYMLITKPFARLLKRLGVVLYQAGDFIEHRGKRAPYLVDFLEGIPSVSRQSEKVKAMIERKHLAYLSISDVEGECTEKVRQQLADFDGCQIN